MNPDDAVKFLEPMNTYHASYSSDETSYFLKINANSTDSLLAVPKSC